MSDTSEVYVRMCDHPKIQQSRNLQVGDFYFSSVENKILISYIEHHQGYIVKHPEQWDYLNGRKIIWLPLPHQIHEMLGIKNVNDYYEAVFDMFFEGGYEIEHSQPSWRFLNSERPSTEHEERFSTPDQLLLGYYVHEKHGLIWENNKWAKIGG